jgi:hypothetical protein
VDGPRIAIRIGEEAEASPRERLNRRHVDAPCTKEIASGVDVLDIDLHTFERAWLCVDVARRERDRPGLAGRHQLHEAVLLVDLDVLLDSETHSVYVERLRAINLSDRNGDEAQTKEHETS